MSEATTTMRAGTARVDITPPAGSELSGFLARTQPATGCADRLMLHALYLDSGDERLLWIHADLIGLEREFVCSVKAALRREFGLTEAQVVLSASHTHSGAASIHLIEAGHYDESYMADLPGRFLHAARQALANPEPAGMVWAETPCELAIDRRGKPSAHTDPILGAFGWRRTDGTYLAVLANYAMHNVALGPESRLISGDVAGRAAALLSASLPGEPVVLWTNGACGNLDPPGLGVDYAPVAAWGNLLASCAARALADAEPVAQPRLICRTRTVPIPLDSLDTSMKYVEQFVRELTGQAEGASLFIAKDGQSTVIRERMLRAARTWQERMSARAGQGPLPSEAPLALHVVDFGPAALACFGAEVFSRMAGDLRRLTASRIFAVGYANGETGYLPPIEAYAEGGYEVDVAYLFYEGLRVSAGAFECVRDQMANLIGGGCATGEVCTDQESPTPNND